MYIKILYRQYAYNVLYCIYTNKTFDKYDYSSIT